MKRRLTGEEIGVVSKILLERFNLISIRVFTTKRLDIPYDNKVSPLAGLDDGIFQYVEGLNKDWYHLKLIDAYLAEYPDDPDMLRFAAELNTFGDIVDEKNAAVPGFSALQKMVNAQPLLNADFFLQQLSRVERVVCKLQIELKDGTGSMGTGFLCGPDLVMTNYHVLEKLIKHQDYVVTVNCIFDYRDYNQGQSVTIVKVKNNDVLCFSETGSLDRTGSDNLNANWDVQKLDYAIIRLEHPIGNEPFGLGESSGTMVNRGWLSFPNPIPSIEPDSHAIIIQHPSGGPKKIALGFQNVIGMDDKQLRLRYRVNTQEGSSGSPIFNEKFELIGLHNSSDAINIPPRYNQGVPIARIKADIDQKGIQLS